MQEVPFTIASFDIGIKNLAFCVMQYNQESPNGKKYNIIEWRNVDLTDTQGISNKICQSYLKTKKDKNGNKIRCKNPAKISVEDKVYCAIHNPDKKKNKINKKQKAYNIPLKKVCITLIKKLDEYEHIWENEVDQIIIETQFKKNRKMICQSNLVYSYFILKHIMKQESRIKDVKYINARNKLKVYKGPKINLTYTNKKYHRKKLAVEHCKHIIRGDKKHLTYLKKYPNKKDDLCDCFLQGAWYLTYARHPRKGRKQLKGISASK